jgi:hypothetical protein
MIDEKLLIKDVIKFMEEKLAQLSLFVLSRRKVEQFIEIKKDLISIIEQQPKADWIPIEKELPKKHDDYFVTVKKISNGKVEYFTAIDTFEPQTKQWYMNIDIPNLEREVIAWQPKCFPKPYERMTEREGKCAFEEKFPRRNDYICKKTALLCNSEQLKFCKYKQPYKKEGVCYED